MFYKYSNGMKIDVEMKKKPMEEDLVCKSSVDRAFLLSPIIASLITVEACVRCGGRSTQFGVLARKF